MSDDTQTPRSAAWERARAAQRRANPEYFGDDGESLRPKSFAVEDAAVPSVRSLATALKADGHLTYKLIGAAGQDAAVQFVTTPDQHAAIQSLLQDAGIESHVRPSGTEGGRLVVEVTSQNGGLQKLAEVVGPGLNDLPSESRTAAFTRLAREQQAARAVGDDGVASVAEDAPVSRGTGARIEPDADVQLHRVVRPEDLDQSPARAVRIDPDVDVQLHRVVRTEDLGQNKGATLRGNPLDFMGGLEDGVAPVVEDAPTSRTAARPSAPSNDTPVRTGQQTMQTMGEWKPGIDLSAGAPITDVDSGAPKRTSTVPTGANGVALGGAAVGAAFGVQQIHDGISNGDAVNTTLGVLNTASASAIVAEQVQTMRGLATAGTRLGAMGELALKQA